MAYATQLTLTNKFNPGNIPHNHFIIYSNPSPVTPTMPDNRDAIYTTNRTRIADFSFDAKVASVFPDMINRSVPGYASIVSSIGLLASEKAQANSLCYDLGCSLGAVALAMRQNIRHPDCRIVAVDNARAMVEGCRKNIDADASQLEVEVRCADVVETEIENASIVALNFTLQFIEPGLRASLIERIFTGLRPGGILVLSEKLEFDDPRIRQLHIDMHHSFKRANGYSDLEISQKRNALEKVLIPETLETHKLRLRKAGFSSVELWFQCFNFASLVAIK